MWIGAVTLSVVAAVLAGVPRAGPEPAGAGALVAAPAPAGPAYGSYDWPVEGPVIRPFDPPDSPFGSGHRGIDIAAASGSAVRAPADGVVAFAGPVAGGLFVSVEHPDGVRTTYSWLSAVVVKAGASVGRGDVLGRTGQGHAGIEPPHLHLGARFAGVYLDPLLLLERDSVVGLIRLAPLELSSGGGGAAG